MKKADALIIAFFALLCAFMFALSFSKSADLTAYVWSDGELVKQVVLSEIEEEHIESFSGCVISFSKDGVSFVSSTCRDKLCVKNGILSKNGDTMACVPNKVVVSVKNAKDEVDAVAY